MELSALRDVRDRARERTGTGEDSTISLLKQRQTEKNATAEPIVARPSATAEERNPEEVVYTPNTEKAKPAAGDESTVGSLLKRRKRDGDNENAG